MNPQTNKSLKDAVVFNDKTVPKESLNFEIFSDRCCLLTSGQYDCDVSKVIGSLFDFLFKEFTLGAKTYWCKIL